RIRPAHHAVAIDVRIDKTANTALAKTQNGVAAGGRGPREPPGGGDPAVSHIHRHRDALAVAAKNGIQEIRVGNRDRADHYASGARFERLIDMIERAQAAAVLNREAQLGADLSQIPEADRATLLGSVEIDDMKSPSALRLPSPGGFDRRCGVDLAACVIALTEPHRPPAEDADRGIEDHRYY